MTTSLRIPYFSQTIPRSKHLMIKSVLSCPWQHVFSKLPSRFFGLASHLKIPLFSLYLPWVAMQQHTWGTSLEQFLLTRLVLDNRQYRVPGCKWPSKNVHQDNKQSLAQSSLLAVVQKHRLDTYDTPAVQSVGIRVACFVVCLLS